MKVRCGLALSPVLVPSACVTRCFRVGCVCSDAWQPTCDEWYGVRDE